MATVYRPPLIATRTSAETKAKFAALAALSGTSESALLMRLIDAVLEHNCAAPDTDGMATGDPLTDRITVRLRPGDRARLNARAAARNMKPATYLAMLLRAHLRRSAPLPISELNLLKAAVSELSAIGRHLHQLSSCMSEGNGTEVIRHLQATAAQVETVRRHVADIVKTNLMSWEAEDA